MYQKIILGCAVSLARHDHKREELRVPKQNPIHNSKKTELL